MKPQIGIVHMGLPNDPLVNALLKACYRKNIPACLYDLGDLCMEDATVAATVWDGEQQRKVTVPVPPISDCRFATYNNYRAKRRNCLEQLKWLRENTLLTEGRGLLKGDLMQRILTSELSAYGIPTYPAKTYRDVLFYISLLKSCIIKPSGGRKGYMVIGAEQRADGVYCVTAEGTQPLTAEYWKNYIALAESANLGIPLIQPRLNFTLPDGRSLDFRVLTAKGAQGTWEVVKISGSVGDDPLVSNISQGGVTMQPEEVLPLLSEEHEARFRADFERIALDVPPLIEKTTGDSLCCFGIDVGIDRDSMQAYVIEANTIPGVRFYAEELADKKTEYFRYIIEHRHL